MQAVGSQEGLQCREEGPLWGAVEELLTQNIVNLEIPAWAHLEDDAHTTALRACWCQETFVRTRRVAVQFGG